MAEVAVTLQAGDQVQQAPAAPPPVMTVFTMGLKQVECEWYVNGTRNTGWFDVSSLHLVK